MFCFFKKSKYLPYSEFSLFVDVNGLLYFQQTPCTGICPCKRFEICILYLENTTFKITFNKTLL